MAQVISLMLHLGTLALAAYLLAERVQLSARIRALEYTIRGFQKDLRVAEYESAKYQEALVDIAAKLKAAKEALNG